ncbi:high frequency lysogenization protein HflD [Thalassotalea nanhaiensis]|uniref:High frequency lysogenization protein HflD homolog n=1 Tax=Thalassotalea nanhaiensis TaxID=3065648 RepID=A0ABY9TNG8_9GAMM|nr:high frequency lysogenization protein HflD [Colwelliaceae bacterium SQ345]
MKEQTLAFAGICQVAMMAQGIARKNHCDEDLFNVMMSSIVNTNPANCLGVYDDKLENVSDGLMMIIAQLGDKNPKKDPEITRYIVSLLNLERRLQNKPKVMAELGSRIEQCSRQLDHFDLDSEHMRNSFASIYTDVISPLGAKIQIAGDPNILKQVGNQHRIRALLLAGIRATVLWRQMGGKRRTILFRRGNFVATAQQLLKQI